MPSVRYGRREILSISAIASGPTTWEPSMRTSTGPARTSSSVMPVGGYVDALVGRHVDGRVEASTHRRGAVLADAAVPVEEEEWSRDEATCIASLKIGSGLRPWCDVALRTRGNRCAECGQRWWLTSGVRRWSRSRACARWTSLGSRPGPNPLPHRLRRDRGRRGSRRDQGCRRARAPAPEEQTGHPEPLTRLEMVASHSWPAGPRQRTFALLPCV